MSHSQLKIMVKFKVFTKQKIFFDFDDDLRSNTVNLIYETSSPDLAHVERSALEALEA